MEKKTKKRLVVMLVAGIFTLSVILPIAAVLVVVVGPMILGHFRDSKILEEGLDAKARIVSIEDTGNRHNRNPVVDLLLEVQPDGGPAFKANVSRTVSVVDLPSYQPGKYLHVKYRPGTSDVAVHCRMIESADPGAAHF